VTKIREGIEYPSEGGPNNSGGAKKEKMRTAEWGEGRQRLIQKKRGGFGKNQTSRFIEVTAREDQGRGEAAIAPLN